MNPANAFDQFRFDPIVPPGQVGDQLSISGAGVDLFDALEDPGNHARTLPNMCTSINRQPNKFLVNPTQKMTRPSSLYSLSCMSMQEGPRLSR